MRLVIAPDKLRGTYTATAAAAALGAGWLGGRPADELVQIPLADGGEGTAEALLRARGGEWREAAVHDAFGRPCDARFAWLGAGEAAVDVAEACGALRVADAPPDPLGATSLGAGELIRAAGAPRPPRGIAAAGAKPAADG